MTRLHPYIAAFLLALWWLLRERWDTLPNFAATEPIPWWAKLIVFYIGWQIGTALWPTIRGGLASVWQRVRTNMPSDSETYATIVMAMLFGCAIGITIGFWHFSQPSPPKPDVPVVKPDEPVKVSAAVYVYEKDNGSVPSGVLVALDKLNKQGILATAFEEDTIDGSGETPSQYKDALEASKDNRPALVVTRGNKLKVHPKVTTTEQVMEACK